MPLPSDISGLWTWLRADAITGLVDGDPVTTWEDSSAANNDGTQTTAGLKPLYKTSVLNGMPAVRFDGSDDLISLPSPAALTVATAFIVIKAAADPQTNFAHSGLWAFGAEELGSHFAWTDGNIYDGFGTTVRKNTGNPTLNLAAQHRIYTVLTKSGEWTSWINGTQQFTTATNTVGWRATVPSIGSTVTGYLHKGDIPEFIVYDNDIGADNRQTVWHYLRAKYFPVPLLNAQVGPAL